MSKHPHFILGISMGAGSQPTAISVLEQEVLKTERLAAEGGPLQLRYLERVPSEENYLKIVERVGTLLEKSEIKDGEKCGETDVVLDVTGSGRAVVELFERAEIKPIMVTITGAGTTEDQVHFQDWRLPKVELIGLLRVAFEAGDRIKMAKKLELRQALIDELRGFKMRPPRIDQNDPELWREAEFDDLVFAVGLACWRASRNVPTPKAVWDEYYEWQKNRPGSPWSA